MKKLILLLLLSSCGNNSYENESPVFNIGDTIFNYKIFQYSRFDEINCQSWWVKIIKIEGKNYLIKHKNGNYFEISINSQEQFKKINCD